MTDHVLGENLIAEILNLQERSFISVNLVKFMLLKIMKNFMKVHKILLKITNFP